MTPIISVDADSTAWAIPRGEMPKLSGSISTAKYSNFLFLHRVTSADAPIVGPSIWPVDCGDASRIFSRAAWPALS